MKNITRGRSASVPAGLLMGAGLATILTIGGAAMLAKLIDQGIVEEYYSGYGIMVILLVASWAQVILSCNMIKRMKLKVMGFSVLMYWLILAAIAALFFGGQYTSVIETTLLIVCGGALGLLTANLRKSKEGKRKIKIRNC